MGASLLDPPPPAPDPDPDAGHGLADAAVPCMAVHCDRDATVTVGLRLPWRDGETPAHLCGAHGVLFLLGRLRAALRDFTSPGRAAFRLDFDESGAPEAGIREAG